MTNRERFCAYMCGKKADRTVLWYGGPRISTFRAWEKQGLLPEQRATWSQFIGEDKIEALGNVNTMPIPLFEVKVLEQRGNKKVWIDEMGVKRVDYVHPATPGFDTRSYLEFPVKNRDDFLEMKKRHNPSDPRRYLPENAIAPAPDPKTWKYDPNDMGIYLNRIALCRNSTAPVYFDARGLYWTIRDWVGLENLCLMFYDDPNLVREMMEFWTDFLIALYDPPLSVIKADICVIKEDMAYKTQALISEKMMAEFMVPCYKRLTTFFKKHGVEFVVMDSDGYNCQILRQFIPAGLDGIQPLEIAAGNDPAVYLAEHPHMCCWGGIDKRELRFGCDRVRAEVKKRFASARKFGRYIPRVDHGVPPDIPLRNFLYMAELMQGFARGEDLDTYEPPRLLERKLGPIQEMFDPLKAVPADGDDAQEDIS